VIEDRRSKQNGSAASESLSKLGSAQVVLDRDYLRPYCWPVFPGNRAGTATVADRRSKRAEGM